MRRLSLLIVVLICLLGQAPQTLHMPPARAQGPQDTGDPLEIALQFLGEHYREYSLKSDLSDLRMLEVVPSLGADHVRFQQTYQGIPVYGAYVTVHIDKARESSPQVTNRYVPVIQISTTKTEVTEETAIEIAREAVGVGDQLRGDVTSELLVYPNGDEHLLAWQIGIPAREPLGDWEIFVDALDGTVLDRFNRMRIDGPLPQGEIGKGKTSIGTREPTHMVRHYFGPGKVGPTDVPKSNDGGGTTILDWEAIWADGFEGDFPGPWNVFDNDGDTNGEYYWDDDDYRPHAGDWEVWPANGGADALWPPANYPNYADSWMVYGPFDLSDAADAELLFYYWSITESDNDYFAWGASIDGTNFYGTQISGDYSGGTAGNSFYLENFDLTNVYTLGNLAGQSQVWVAFIFQSDYSITYEGTYVDDVVIRKDTASCGGDPNTGYSFNPNPVVTSGDTSLVDNGNVDTATLTAERQLGNLLGLDGSGQLVGPHVDLTAPGITGAYKPAGQANEAACLYYDYTRSDDRFEEVTIYYQIDSLQRYIQSLGFTNVNNRAIPVHAHYFGDDQSFYSPAPGDLGLHFGDGGVDDGEDGDIIIHEYGHAIQDNQVPGWGATNEGGAMGEGFSDYLAASFFASANGGFNRECIGDWDATSYSTDNPPCLRRVDGTKHYPEDMQGEVHADGEIWSAALWDLWLALGREVTDRLVIESHFYLDPMSEFEDGANAILSADQNLYGESHRATICGVFIDRGILDHCEDLTFKLYVPLVMKKFGGVGAGIVNGDFEDGPTGWAEYSTHGWDLIVDGFPGIVTPHSGNWAAWLGGEYDEISYIQQQVTVPLSSPYLAYWHWIASEDYCGYDFGGVIINGSTVVDVYNLCESTSTNGWVKHVVNLSAYAGQSVFVQIRTETDSSLNSNLFVDDVAFQATSSSMQEGMALLDLENAMPKSVEMVPRDVGETGIEAEYLFPRASGP